MYTEADSNKLLLQRFIKTKNKTATRKMFNRTGNEVQ